MRGNARTTTRVGAYIASGALVLSGTILAVTPAEAVAHDPIGLNQGATWLAGELDNGLMHNDNFGGFDDYGLSIDAGLALAAVPGRASTVDVVSAAIARNIVAYVGNDAPEAYSGAAAKAAVLAQAANDDPTAYGAVNLVARIEARVSSASPIQGRLEDKSTIGDFANTLGQAFAANALTRAGSSKAVDAVAFLIKQQCPNGGFRLSFTADKTAVDQSCTNSASAETDATAIALQQLNQLPATGAVTAARAAARGWLADAQKNDGSWGGGAGTEASNANSTGLAAVALGDVPESEDAATWLRARQATGYNACDKLAGQRGAIAYDDAGLAAGRRNGITSAQADQWRRASAQAVPALAYLPLDTTPSAPSLSAPTGYLKAGTLSVLTTTGVASGDRLCLTGVGAAVQSIAAGSTLRTSVTLPAGSATRVYTVRDSLGHADTASMKVLGRTNLGVLRSKFKVKRKRAVTATVRYLAPGEWARIVYKGRLVRSGKATSAGTFSASFRVGRAKGRKTIVGYGQFTDLRRGTAVIKVVR